MISSPSQGCLSKCQAGRTKLRWVKPRHLSWCYIAGVTEVLFLLNSPMPLGTYTLRTGLPCSRVNSHSSPTLCCHDGCSFPLIVLVALNCTYTNMSMSFLYIGIYNQTQLFTCGQGTSLKLLPMLFMRVTRMLLVFFVKRP